MKGFYLSRFVAMAGLMLVSFSGPAAAITFKLVTNDTATVPTTSSGYQIPNFVQDGTTVDFVNSSSPGEYRSPWESTKYSDLKYTSVRKGTAGYNLVGTGLSLFWGSPDAYNTLTFWTGANGTGASVDVSGALLGVPQALGHHLVAILTSETFRSVTFTSTIAAFEYANLAATPLPGALVLFGSALSGLGILNWLRRRRAGNPALSAA